MSELSNPATSVARAPERAAWLSDTVTLALRISVFACAVAGVITTRQGLDDAWSRGVVARFGQLQHELWGMIPYAVLLSIAVLRLSRRSLAVLLVTTLLAWFMSTGYSNLDEMGLGIGVIPLVQLAFIAGALTVMFTFWLLRSSHR